MDLDLQTGFFVDPANFNDPPKEADIYQCLAIRDPEYPDEYVKQYHCFSSYESDQEYLKFFDLMMNHIKCDDYHDNLLLFDRTARSLAMQFRNMSPKLIPVCAMDTFNLLNTLEVRRVKSQMLFQVWKGVVKEKWNIDFILQSVYYLPGEYFMMKSQCGDLLERVFQIEETMSDDDAFKLIYDLQHKDSNPRKGLYYDYVLMKQSIAEKLGIIPCQNTTSDAKLNERVQALLPGIQDLSLQETGEEEAIVRMEG